jgi:hypothetical protein
MLSKILSIRLVTNPDPCDELTQASGVDHRCHYEAPGGVIGGVKGGNEDGFR